MRLVISKWKMLTVKQSVFLVCLFLATGCVVRIGGDGFEASWQGTSGNLDEKVQRTVEREAPLGPDDTVSITTQSGTISVTGGSDAVCHVKATITARAKHPEDAQRLAEEIDIQLKTTADGLAIDADLPKQMKDRDVRIDYDVQVPRQCHLDCHSAYGGLSIEDIQGGVSGRSGSGGLDVRSIEGPVDLKTSYGSIDCAEVTTGPVVLETGSGSIHLDHVSARTCRAESSYGTIQGNDIRADEAHFRTGSGSVTLTRLTAPKLEAQTSYGSVSLEEGQSDEITLKSGSGNIQVSGLHGERMRIDTAYGQIRCEAFTCRDLYARSGSGNVVVHFLPASPGDARAEATSGYGRVEVTVPDAFAGEVDLKTGYGTIECDLPVTVQGKLAEGQLKGTTGQGTGRLSAHSNSGGIRIKCTKGD